MGTYFSIRIFMLAHCLGDFTLLAFLMTTLVINALLCAFVWCTRYYYICASVYLLLFRNIFVFT